MRLTLAIASMLAVGGLASAGWWLLSGHEVDHYAELSHAESYATRSHLSREVDTQLRAMREVAAFWSFYGHLPSDQWDQDAQIELGHFEGIDRIVWHDPERDIRYIASTDAPAYDRRPAEDEWAALRRLLDGVDPSAGAMILGPVEDEDGHQTYRVQVPAIGRGASGVLVAQVDAFEQLEGLLRERSPGYAIGIYWDGTEMYRRGEPAPDIPDDWVRDGLIELSLGPLWKVVHSPTPERAASFTRPAVLGLLVAGWVIAALVGFLIFQNGRVRERAVAAERAEASNRELNAELEQKVAQRTRELGERTADLETITESIAHDLRAPLHSIGLGIELLRSRPEDQSTLQTTVQRLERAKSQAVEVIDRMRHFSEVSFVEFNRKEIDMDALAREVCGELLDLEPPPEPDVDIGSLPACKAHPTLVKILLVNLMSNALKYTRSLSKRQLEVGFSEQHGYYVRDNGCGFDQAEAKQMFEPFSRLGEDTEGLGLGLAIAARIVHRHGGEISAESTPGGGATFYFNLGDMPPSQES